MTDQTLLTYAISTDPDPVQVSTNNHNSTANLTVVASNSAGRSVDIQSVSFQFMTGSNARDLSGSDVTTFQVAAPSGWAASTDKTTSTITMTPNSPPASVGPAGLTFGFIVPISDQTGTSTVTLTETSTSAGENSVPLSVSKFPLDFTVEPLSATPPVLDGPQSPTTLNWNVYGGSSQNDGDDKFSYTLAPVTYLPGATGAVGASGPLTTANLPDSQKFTLTVGGVDDFGNDVFNQSSVYVAVGPPKVLTFSIAGGGPSATINYGESASLAWTTENATNVQLNEGQVIYTIDTLNSDGFVMTPLETTSYQLSAQYKDGDVNELKLFPDAVTINIAPPEVTSMSINPPDGQRYVNSSTYQISFELQSANYAMLKDESGENEPVWVAADASPVSIPTPKQNGTTYSLTAYQLPPEVVLGLESDDNAPAKLAKKAPSPNQQKKVTINFDTSPLMVQVLNTQVGNQTQTAPFGSPIASYIALINGFYFRYANDENHWIASLAGFISDPILSDDKMNVTVTAVQYLNDTHNPWHTISSQSTLDIVIVALPQGSPSVLSLAPPNSDNPFSMPDPNISDPINTMVNFTWTGDQSQFNSIDISMGTASVSNGNSVTTTGQKFNIQSKGKGIGSSSETWSTLAAIVGEGGGCDILGPYTKGGSYDTDFPIDSVYVLGSEFSVNDGTKNRDFHSLNMEITPNYTAGQSSFSISMNNYWHYKNNTGFGASVSYYVLVIYQPPPVSS